MQEVNAQMLLKLHQLSGEPIANCNYLLAQTRGDYDLALKILQRILEQRKINQEQGILAGDNSMPAESGGVPEQESALEALEVRVVQLETRFAMLADTLDAINEKLTVMLGKVSDSK